jgi:DNA-binding ferritin-like protein
MNEELLKAVQRIKVSEDGKDFYNFLLTLSLNNYKAFKCSPKEFNDVHKGQAIAVDGIIELFDTCEERIKAIQANQFASQQDINQESWI